MVKYIVLDFGMVLAYPTTGNWHITPKFIELVDINKLNREQLKKAFDNNKELLDKKIVNMEEEYNMFFEFYNNILEECNYPNYKKEIAEKIAFNRTYERDKYTPYDNIKNELIALSKKYELLLLSDNWPDAIKSLKDYQIYDLFSKVYISSIYGQVKKNGDFFDNPIRDFNIKKGEAIFIDDNEGLLEIALNKGFEVRLMDRERKIEKSKFKIIHDLKQI